MQKPLIRFGLVITLVAMVAFTQTPGGGSRPSQQGRLGFTRHLEHLTQALNLSDSQKEQVGAIFQQARVSAQPVLEELSQTRAKLTAATKDGASDVESQKLADEQGRLIGKLVAIRAQARSRFYRVLTPEQRVKAEQMHEQFRHHPGKSKTGP